MVAPRIVTPAQARVSAAARVPMGVRRLKLASPTIEGFMTRWFNDDPPGRINEAQRGGWEFVFETDSMPAKEAEAPVAELSGRVARIVGTNKQGQAITAYLMKIKREWWDADQAAKAQLVADSHNQVRAGRIGQTDGDGRYTSGISVR